RLYFVRAFAAPDDAGPDYGRARWPAAGGSSPAAPFLLQARFPGRAGNFTVSFIFKLGENILHTEPVDPADTNPAAPTHQVLRGAQAFDTVLAETGGSPGAAEVYWV